MSRARLVWSTFGEAPMPMGLQGYQHSLIGHLTRSHQEDWTFQQRRIGSLRAPESPDVRLPLGLLYRAGSRTALAAGRIAYRGADAVHRFDLRLPPAAVPEVVTVHDLPPLRFDDEGTLPPWSAMSARRARCVIAPSAFAAEEVVSLLGVTDVAVIPNGVAPLFFDAQPLTDSELGAAGLPRRFMLHCAGATARKNLSALAEAWVQVAAREPGLALVLAGPADPRRTNLFRTLPRTHLVGFQRPDAVARLMASSVAVVVPSTYEGFGLPAIEAMAAGTPVIAARCGALPEVCGDAGVLVDPTPEALTTAILDVLRDEPARTELSRRGCARAATFSWGRSAAAHLDCYARTLS